MITRSLRLSSLFAVVLLAGSACSPTDGSDADGGKDAGFDADSGPAPVAVTEITLSTPGGGTTLVGVGKTLQLQIAIAPDKASIRAVAWSVDAATVATVSAVGLVTAVGNGTVTITATARDGSAVVGTISLEVVECNRPSDCATSTNECLVPTCTANVCGAQKLGRSHVLSTGQTAGDCQTKVCDGNGGITSIDASTDLPVAVSSCQNTPACTGTPLSASLTNKATGTTCTTAGSTTSHVCGDTTKPAVAGKCVQCNVTADCALAPSALGIAGTCNASNVCVCGAGHTYVAGQGCLSNDVCGDNLGGCDTHATCASTGLGTNSCTCATGYNGDGTSAGTGCDLPTLNISIVGLGSGAVSGTGLNCFPGGGVCSIDAVNTTTVVLTALADTGYTFVGWRGGGCSGTGSCTVTLTDNVTVKAGFAAATFYTYDSSNGQTGVLSAPLSGTAASTKLSPPGVPDAASPTYVYASSADGMVFTYLVNADATGAVTSFNEWLIWVIDLWAGEAHIVGPTQTTTWPPPITAGSMSQDGKSIAFLDNSASPINLKVVKTDGTGLVSITNQTSDNLINSNDCHYADCVTMRFVTWSPDGTHLAWVDSNPLASDGTATAYDNVWIAKADGTGVTRLTNFNSTTIDGNPDVFGADWSADGTRVGFVSQQDPGAARTGDSGAPTVTNVWTVDVTTGALFCVTNFASEYRLDMATWARTGQALVFGSVQDPALGTTTGGRNLFTVNADGTGLRALTLGTNSSSLSAGPYWHPDQKTLLFESTMDPTDLAERISGMRIWGVTLDQGAVAAPVTFTENVWDYSPLESND